MHFLKLYKFFCVPSLRLVGSYPKKCSSSHTVQKITPPNPVPLAYSEFLVDDNKADIITDSPIFILHGLLGSKNNWKSISKSIATITRRKTVALDLRNHGDSPHSNEFSYLHMMADLKQLINEQGVQEGKASIMGHSIGGRVAMALALEEPHTIRDLVVVDISPFGLLPNVDFVSNILNTLEGISLTPGVPLHDARKEASVQMKKVITSEKLRHFLLSNLIIDEKTKNFVWKINVQSIKANFPSLMAFPKFKSIFKGPSLFIGGERSLCLKKEDEGDIKKLFPNAVFQYISGAGHLVHVQKPNEFLQVVCPFLKNM